LIIAHLGVKTSVGRGEPAIITGFEDLLNAIVWRKPGVPPGARFPPALPARKPESAAPACFSALFSEKTGKGLALAPALYKNTVCLYSQHFTMRLP
jgi:hypothetical protein